ncbi:nitroreductase [Candidatus Geothermarchaeota archaeon]|nr:MAG: nitroreductase [Candidatus Geothermarchaeota archaeon]
MDVIDAIRKRRSIRRYERKEISREALNRLLEAARLAPSAKNIQPWKLVVVTDDSLKRKLVRACLGQTFIGECSAVIVGVGDPSYKWHVVDTTIALEHIVLEAVELGLGTCWIGAFNESEVKRILGIPEDKKVVACLTVGYPAESPSPRPKKSIEELVCFNRYK